jgi:Protein kinase domain
MPPEKLGPFRLLRSLGRGGMAEVWVARKLGSLGASQPAVVKRILPHEAKNRAFVDSFIDEARLSARLQHPNIVRVLDVGEHDDRPFIAMELVDGADLEGLLTYVAREGSRLPVPLAALIAANVLRGLGYAHALCDQSGAPLDIVHRDVSPPNILIDRQGAVKLSDFGIAKARGRLTKTRLGLLKGKPPYLSPEQASGAAVDHRSDLFSLGVVFWECLTGERLFDTGDDLRSLERVRAAQVQPPSALRGEIHPEIDEVVLRLLAAKPERRYPDAATALRELELTVAWQMAEATELGKLVAAAAPEELSRLPMPTSEFEFSPRPSAAPSRRRWWFAAALLVAAATAFALWPSAGWQLPATSFDAGGEATLVVNPGHRGDLVLWDGFGLGATPLSSKRPLDGKRHEIKLLAPRHASGGRGATMNGLRTLGARDAPRPLAGTVIARTPVRIGGAKLEPGQTLRLPIGWRRVDVESGGHRWMLVRAGETVTLD